MIKQTHTFARLEISSAAFQEIEQKLKDVNYDHVFHYDSEEKIHLIDMQGIALASELKQQHQLIKEGFEKKAGQNSIPTCQRPPPPPAQLPVESELEKENRAMRKILQGILDSTVHPDVAVRALLVDLKPIRNILTKKNETRT